MKRLLRWALLAHFPMWALLALGAAQAQDVLPVPPLDARVIDQTGTLSAEQRGALEAKLAAFEAASGPQIVLLLVPATAPEDIASYAQRVGESWKIGRREVGDGLLLVVAKNERKVRIEVAKALEGAIPDLAARQIIDSAIKPAFRADDYAGGLNAAVDKLMERIRGEHLPTPEAAPSRVEPEDTNIALFFFIAVPLVGSLLSRLLGRRVGSVLTAGAAGGVAWWITASMVIAVGAGVVALVLVGIIGVGSLLSSRVRGRDGSSIGGWGGGWTGGGGGWSGGSSSGGGFSSGGGGDFGGGGASGDW
jgi:uncharacterized protein